MPWVKLSEEKKRPAASAAKAKARAGVVKASVPRASKRPRDDTADAGDGEKTSKTAASAKTKKTTTAATGSTAASKKKLCVTGTWANEYNSTLKIGKVAPSGTFTGSYQSSTGATGVYPVVGVADPAPDSVSQAVSFSVSWRSLEGPSDPSWHWVSGFTGVLQVVDGEEVIKTTYLLQQNITDKAPSYMATAVYNCSFKRKTSA